MAVLLANNATSRLASSLTAAATTLSVTTGEGAKFPSPTGGDWFPLTLIKSSGALEIVKCTARSGDVLTITRAQEATLAQAFSAGDRVEVRYTKGAHDAVIAMIMDLSNAALLDANNLSDLADAAVARQNLGLQDGATTPKQATTSDTEVGRLMVNGAHGLGGNMVNWPSSTINDYTVKTGFYRAASEVTGFPYAEYWGVRIERAPDGAYVRQSIWCLNRRECYERIVVSGSPGDWLKVLTSGNVSAFIQTLLDDGDAAAARATLDVYSKVEAEGIAIGVGQTWQNVTASRASGTTYTNTTGKPIMVSVYSNVFNNNKAQLSAYVDGLNIQVSLNHSNYTGRATVCFIVPAASTYRVTPGYTSIAMWAELR